MLKKKLLLGKKSDSLLAQHSPTYCGTEPPHPPEGKGRIRWTDLLAAAGGTWVSSAQVSADRIQGADCAGETPDVPKHRMQKWAPLRQSKHGDIRTKKKKSSDLFILIPNKKNCDSLFSPKDLLFIILKKYSSKFHFMIMQHLFEYKSRIFFRFDAVYDKYIKLLSKKITTYFSLMIELVYL